MYSQRRCSGSVPVQDGKAAEGGGRRGSSVLTSRVGTCGRTAACRSFGWADANGRREGDWDLPPSRTSLGSLSWLSRPSRVDIICTVRHGAVPSLPNALMAQGHRPPATTSAISCTCALPSGHSGRPPPCCAVHEPYRCASVPISLSPSHASVFLSFSSVGAASCLPCVLAR